MFLPSDKAQPLDQIYPDIFGNGGSSSTSPTSFGEVVDSGLPEIPAKAFSNSQFNAEAMVEERLYTIMPRDAGELYTGLGYPQYTSERGQIASLRLLTSNAEASIKGRDGKEVNLDQSIRELIDGYEGYKNFFLTDVQVSYNEKIQITPTFGDNEVVYYFGRQPVIFNLSGIVFDSLYSDWFTKFLALYQTTLRGSQLAQYFELVELVLPNMRLIGSIQGLSHQQNSARDAEVYFSMQFVAKQVIPTPIPELTGTIANLSGELVDFSVGKEGVGGFGYRLSTGIGAGMQGGGYGIGSIFSEVRPNLGNSALENFAREFSESLNDFRTSIFSPVYGIISSIIKIIKDGNGNLSGIIKSFTDPVNLILRDIRYVATEAVAIANLIETTVNDVISIPERVVINARNTIRTLEGSAGVISRVPETISETLKRHNRNGRVKKGAAILKSGKGNTKDKGAVLSSGVPYSPAEAYKI